MNRSRNDVQQPLEFALKHTAGRTATCLLHDKGHGEALIKHSQLSLRGLGICGVEVDSTVEDRSVHVGHHGSNIAGSIRLVAVLPLGDDALNGGIPISAVTFIAAVNLLAATLWKFHMRLDVDELPQRWVQGKSMHTMTFEGNDQLGGGSIHAIAGHHDVVARPQDVVHCRGTGGLLLVDGKNGACTNIAIDVAAAIQRIKGNHEATRLVLWDEDGVLVLFRDQHSTCTAIGQGIDKDFVG
mmetsp:Transcript_99656/g.121877  ORF Transcript_99656/g.121877 Transcript_99656/m.121877 type:complete len:241 (+) Transcript_99656:315-1037(+)